jgi:ABC-type nitrate/sulfonate/bicarbonate transport system substrate-binding protein
MAVPKKRALLAIAAAILIIAIVLSSFVYVNSQKPYTGNVESITIGIFPHEVNSLIYIANDQQYFLNSGLNVTIKNYARGMDAVNGVINGELDIGTASEFVITQEALQNVSIQSIGSASKALPFFVVARTDKGISGISDLVGKTIGVTLGTNGQFYFGLFLELNNISQSQVTLVNVPTSQLPSAIANGTVDAVMTFQPFINQIESLLPGKTVMWPAQSDQYAYQDAICNPSWATAHPDLIVRFLKAMVQAENYVAVNKAQSMAIVANTLNYPSSYLASVWPNYQFSVTLDQSQIVAMQGESQWLITNKLTNATTIPNFLNYVYVNGLKSVKPRAVNIIS